ncbi:dephospho-CoA kinase [Corynebacterium sp. SCR221107]|uniref:dephospho-CoA kinase n=1 Tax=Corynebacterium sp. SCR221107 TaxID=3017361 RepID=UPI0022EC25CD|nr:dephospho-CoA kinase [Corynebacterium sp. SCR221107]WBT09909.1 dephospho-CoA kinase [Corynebacterium sp. SCR221107]
MKRVGLTGGIGSGKSTVARMLAKKGAPVIDADQIAREIVAPGQPALEELAKEFGTEILQPDGTLNRAALAERAFATPEATARLNAITHPRIEQRTAQLFDGAQAQGYPFAVWDMPLLVDNGYHENMDFVIVVDVDPETRVRRLVKFRGLDEADARRRIAAQVPDHVRIAAADFVVDNNADEQALTPQVDRLWKLLEEL